MTLMVVTTDALRRYFLCPEGDYGVLAERRSACANSAAQVRQRQFRATVELVGAARAFGDALAAGSGRGQGHRGASPGDPGQALTDLPF